MPGTPSATVRKSISCNEALLRTLTNLPHSLESEPPSPGPGGIQHNLPVKMSHPCVLQACRYLVRYWRVQPGGPDICIFCMEAHVGCSRCPECQALACERCLELVRILEQKLFILGNYTYAVA